MDRKNASTGSDRKKIRRQILELVCNGDFASIDPTLRESVSFKQICALSVIVYGHSETV